ncbi:non-specific lipid-transfer protein 1-like [Malania oleifera]|uniref:non-specific lipid-transfer protein 1-like n=1 Tax=Malania oleifera TaxID=397392 RepID=UPI0025AE0B95|nr:non-specific lipid-transfer protein 1-like [Malania oleifera]
MAAAASRNLLKLGCLVLAACAAAVLAQETQLAAPGPLPPNRPNCSVVVTKLADCKPSPATPSPACCEGAKDIKGLFQSAKTTDDRQAICQCLTCQPHRGGHGPAPAPPGLQYADADYIFDKCNVQLPFPLTNTTNCKTAVK